MTSAGIHPDQAASLSDRPESRTVRELYQTRIETLCKDAADEGYSLAPASESDFWHFVESMPPKRRGNLVLVDNGNLRATWGDGQETHLGLQFLGDGMVQFVIFRRRKPQGPISRVAGRDTISELDRQIDAFDLHSLLYA